jgi:hypothetical protein
MKFFTLIWITLVFSNNLFSQAKKAVIEEMDSKESLHPINHIPPNLIKFSAFVDTYYSHNLNKPKVTERNYTTQAVRNDEFNINLAHVDAKIEADRFRGRLALQVGTSVNANYLPESTNQRTSNQISIRNIQEAYAGIRLGKNTWLDGGIYFGHIGFESWISGNNWMYTRALVLDYVPYYSSGFRLSHDLSDKLKIQFHVMNGWSVITDNNKNKSVGFQIYYKPIPHLSLTYNTYIGNEISTTTSTLTPTGQINLEPKGNERQTRYYQNYIGHYDISSKFSVAASFDIGFQRNPLSKEYNPVLTNLSSTLFNYDNGSDYITRESKDSYRQWHNGTIWVTYKFLPDWRISGRLERYTDREFTNVAQARKSDIYSRTPYTEREKGGYKVENGFQVSAASLCLDYIINELGMLRIEGKVLKSLDPLFDYRNSSDLSKYERILVTAITLKFE